MFLAITDVLSKAEIAAICEELKTVENAFASGRATAGAHARAVKDNEQATVAASSEILKRIETTLLANPVFKAAAMPKAFVKLMISRYQPGMHYGTHVDDPLMNGVRTDLSFTLFLEDPEKYGGGELVIEENDGDRDFKLSAGGLVLYPTTTLHHVAEVTSGIRLAIVGWVRSYVREDSKRELIFDLENALATLRAQNAARPVLDQLYKVRANLVRMWADD
jgi:PKHD-type hydroxylase